ncbi:MAG: peptidase domain-containing ABC transporter [Bacillota bacterium]
MKKDEIKQLLTNTSFLSVVKEEEIETIASGFEEISFQLGNTVCRAGEEGEAFYVIYSGRARVVGLDSDGKEINLHVLSRGDHFGEQALLTGEPYEYTIRATGNLSVLRLSKANFSDILKEYQELKHYFDEYISDVSLRNFLKQCTVFSPLNPGEMRGFLDSFSPVNCPAGEFIFREGEEGDSFYLIRSGEVEVVKESQGGRILNRLKKGDFFGELALLTGAPRFGGVRAVTDVKLYRLAKKDFEAMLSTIPQIRNAILGIAARYSQAARQMISGSDVEPELKGDSEPVQDFPPQLETFAAEPVKPETVEEVEDAGLFSPRRRWRYSVLLQQSETDCGAACLSMISHYYGLKISINRLREMANVTRDGATMHSLAETAEKIGFRAKGVRAGYDSLKTFELPAVAHWEGYHYIVVYSVNERQAVVADPALGLKKISREEFMRGWNGLLLLLQPTPGLREVLPSKSSFARFYPFVLAHRDILVKVFVASLVLQVFGLAMPVFTQNIVDKVLVQQDITVLNVMLAGMLVIAVFQVAYSALRQYMLVFASTRIDLSLMTEFYGHVLGLPLKYFEDRKVGDIISRFNENSKIRELLTGTSLSVAMDFLTVIVYFSLMFYYNWKLSLAVLLFIPLFAAVTLFFTPMMKKVSREAFQAGAETQSYIVESINGINTVKACAAERPVRWNWEEKLEKMLSMHQKGSMIAMAADSSGRILQTLSSTFVLWYGARLVMAGEVTIGQLMAFNVLLGSVITPILRTVGLWDRIQEARIALERLNDVFEAEPEQKAGESSITMPPVSGHVVLKNVTFRYGSEGRNVLQNINLEIPPGKTVALVGRSGSGKTTLANLLLRLHQPVEGSILIDGVDIRHVAADSLRRQIGMVLQENFLFSGTIKENIAFGNTDPPMNEVIAAAMMAGAHDFISELPLGYEAVIGERGMSLSGGQRQRIAIARALFTRPKILILDEATSALDTESERIIQQNFESMLNNRTTIVIAHRLSTVRNADMIVVLDRGIIVEKGIHYELMDKKGLYFYLCSQQIQG